MITLQFLVVVLVLVIVFAMAAYLFTLRAMCWGATMEECAMPMPGDAYLTGEPGASVVMTRAVTIDAPTDQVWPWLAQLGRGAGWYSYDLLDNGAKMSARHVVTWIPPPAEGDASPIGYLRRIVAGSALTWWADGAPFLGSSTRLVVDLRLTPDGDASRLVIRMSGDATGGLPSVTLGLFRFIDSIMARRQLICIRDRVDRHGARTSNPEHPETGARNQYQHWEAVYRSGERAGTPGKEQANMWRRAAIEARVIPDAAGSP